MFYFTKKKQIKQIQDLLDKIEIHKEECYALADELTFRISVTDNEADKEKLRLLRNEAFDTADELYLDREQITLSDFYIENLLSFY